MTYLFINRNVVHRERPRALWVKGLIALAWGVTYALLFGSIWGGLGLLFGVATGAYAFFA